mmetsp:Transcript_4236/g.17025  ORF Transcript_4236/g.17025 Transcript_4236/m.17025 type:complete len:287 (-) Transcript_4236:40-900(-)
MARRGRPREDQGQDLPGLHLQPHQLGRAGEPALPGGAQARGRAGDLRGRRGGGPHQGARAHLPGRVPAARRGAARQGPQPHRKPARAQRELLQVRGLDRAHPQRHARRAGAARRGVDALQDDPPLRQGDRRRVQRVLLVLQEQRPHVLPGAHRRLHRGHALLPLVPPPGPRVRHRGRHPPDERPRHPRRAAAHGHDRAGRRRGQAPHQQRQPDAQRRGLLRLRLHRAGVRRLRLGRAPRRGGVVGQDQGGGHARQGVRRRHHRLPAHGRAHVRATRGGGGVSTVYM